MKIDPKKEKQILEDKPPFFRTWTGMYALVLGVLGLLVLIFHLFTQHYQ